MRTILSCILLVVWLGPLAVGMADALGWFLIGHAFSSVDWGVATWLFLVFWTVVGLFVVAGLTAVFGDESCPEA